MNISLNIRKYGIISGILVTVVFMFIWWQHTQTLFLLSCSSAALFVNSTGRAGCYRGTSLNQAKGQSVGDETTCVCVCVRACEVNTIFGTMQLVGLGSLRKPVLSASEPQFKHQMNHRHTVATTNSCAASVPHTLKDKWSAM